MLLHQFSSLAEQVDEIALCVASIRFSHSKCQPVKCRMGVVLLVLWLRAKLSRPSFQHALLRWNVSTCKSGVLENITVDKFALESVILALIAAITFERFLPFKTSTYFCDFRKINTLCSTGTTIIHTHYLLGWFRDASKN